MASASPRLPLVHCIQAGRYCADVAKDCDSSEYAFEIAMNNKNTVMAVSLSTNAVRLYSPSTGQCFGDCLGHTDTISHLAYAEQMAPNLLCSSSTDGTLRAWDVRTRSQAGILRPKSARKDIWSFSSGGSTSNLFVAGVGPQLIFWDWRTKQQLLCLEELHTEDVTQVQFFPDRHEKVVSASVDGLICTVDVNGSTKDDEGLESVINVGTSVSRFGFIGESHKQLWCLTHIETLSIWHVDSAVIEADFGDIRNKLASKWPLSTTHVGILSSSFSTAAQVLVAAGAGILCHDNKVMVQYLVDCHYSSSLARIWVLGGTRHGSVGYFPLRCAATGDTHVGAASAILDGGHCDVVRTVWTPHLSDASFSSSAGLLHWSTGEDGRVCGWSNGGNLS